MDETHRITIGATLIPRLWNGGFTENAIKVADCEIPLNYPEEEARMSVILFASIWCNQDEGEKYLSSVRLSSSASIVCAVVVPVSTAQNWPVAC